MSTMLENAPANAQVLLVVDQFEEVFTALPDVEAQAF
jgi:hypothetical protein